MHGKCFMWIRNRQYYAWKAQISTELWACLCMCGIWWNITIIQHEIRFSIRAGVITKEWILYQKHAAKTRASLCRFRPASYSICFLWRRRIVCVCVCTYHFQIYCMMMRLLLLFTSPLLCVIFGFYILILPWLCRLSLTATFSFPLLFFFFFYFLVRLSSYFPELFVFVFAILFIVHTTVTFNPLES